MFRLRKSVLSFGAAALAVVALALVLPRAADAVAAALVEVVNTTANPVITSRMDDPGRIPYTSSTGSSSPCNQACTFDLPAVPAQHRLVLDNLGGSVELNSSGFVSAQVYCANCGDPRNNGITIPNSGVLANQFSTPIHLYFDAGQVPRISLAAGASIFTQAVTVSGYLLDCSAAPCAAMAH
jgi:hypothetical protein